jgi:hypothetical protein
MKLLGTISVDKLFRNPEEGQDSQRAVVPVMMMMMISVDLT